ncbi:MAG: low temperature requirement protein A [Thermomicrobiales bacterium]
MHRIVRRGETGRQAADPLELFYDLVFVFTITQVSHLLLSHLTWTGLAESLVVVLAIWWSWNYTTWFTNEVDVQAPVVRLLMIGLMGLSLLMAISVAESFGERALLFAGAYVAIQVIRHGFLAFVAAEAGTLERRRAVHILVWFLFAGIFWIAGAVVGGHEQLLLWAIAALIDYGAPLLTFWLPGRERLPLSSWQVVPEHFDERFHLFVILTLGETIMITGTTTAGLPLDPERVIAFGLAFAGTVALWWLYFQSGITDASHRLEHAENSTALARDAYTYGQVPIVAAIILSAVGDEFVIAHPGHHLEHAQLLVVIGGPLLFLLAEFLVFWRLTGIPAFERLAGAILLLAVGWLGLHASAETTSALVVAVLILVIIAGEARTRRGGWSRAAGSLAS